MNEAKAKGYHCPRCTVGRCLPSATTFCDIQDEQLLAIPNVPAYICDVCHFAEFEQDTLEALWQALYGDGPKDDYQAIAPGKHSTSYGE